MKKQGQCIFRIREAGNCVGKIILLDIKIKRCITHDLINASSIEGSYIDSSVVL
jgi:hypothetical protein